MSSSAAARDRARELGVRGQAALEDGRFDVAAEFFEQADGVLRAPTFRVRLARARAGQGRLVEAYEIYDGILRDGVAADAPAPFKRALAEARAALLELEPRLAWAALGLLGLENVIRKLEHAIIVLT